MEQITELIEIVANPLNRANLVLSVVSFFINCLHLLVLTRQSFHSSSINCLMIGIAISDICTMFLTVEKFLTLVDIERDDCLTADSLPKMYMGLASWALQDYFRRCSTWMALLMATVRILIVRNALNKKLSKTSFGRLLAFFTFVFAFIPSFFFYSRFQVLEDSRLALPLGCAEFQDIHANYKYSLQIQPLFSFNNQIVLRIYLMVDAVVSKFVPCLCFPLCTILLIRALRAAKSKENSLCGREDRRRADATTKLVMFTTIAFFVAEAPLGVILTIRAFFNTDVGLIIASIDVISVFTFLLTVNSTCHLFICAVLSRQYRKTLRRFVRWEQLGRIVSGSRNRKRNDVHLPSISMVPVTR